MATAVESVDNSSADLNNIQIGPGAAYCSLEMDAEFDQKVPLMSGVSSSCGAEGTCLSSSSPTRSNGPTENCVCHGNSEVGEDEYVDMQSMSMGSLKDTAKLLFGEGEKHIYCNTHPDALTASTNSGMANDNLYEVLP